MFNNMLNLTLTYFKLYFLIPNFLLSFFIFFYSIKKYNLPTINFVGGLLVLSLLFFEYYFYGNHNTYEWVTSGDKPILLQLIDSKNLKNDFYTNAIIGSPKIIFYYLVYFVNKIAIKNIDNCLFLLKILQIFLIPFFAYYILISFIKVKNIILYSISLSIIVLFCSGYFDFILYVAKIGINSFTSWKDLSPQSFSFIFGLVSIIFKQKKYYFFSFIFLFIVSILHFYSGLVFLIIHFILDDDKFEKNYFIYLVNKIFKLKYFFVAILIPYLVINIFFLNELPSNFFEIYVIERHPHHYLVSSFFNIYSLIFISLPILGIFIGIILNNKIFLYESITIILFFYSCILIQFIGSEILNLNFITLLGPTRLLSISIFLLVYLLIKFINLFSNYV